MYGASVRDDSCSFGPMYFVNEQGKPHCFYHFEKSDGYVNISFDPGLNCDSNGKPQCANISYVFNNTSVYRGETISLSACIVGYDFGTTVGIIHARSLYSKRDKLQQITNSRKCTSFNYTVYSRNDYEVVFLQTSSLPVSAYISNGSTQQDILSHNSQILDSYSHNQFGCITSDLLTTPVFISMNP